MKGVKNLKMYKGCIIIVDMVNGFVKEGVLHDEGIEKIVPRVIELIKEAKEEGKLIVFVKDAHTKDSVELEYFGTHCLKDTTEAQLIDDLKVFEDKEDTISIEKNSRSFIEAPGFRKLLKEQPTLEEFDIVGCCTEICVMNGAMGLTNYLDQWNRPHKVRVHEDAIATYGEEKREEYIEAAKLLMAQQEIEIVNKQQLIKRR